MSCWHSMRFGSWYTASEKLDNADAMATCQSAALKAIQTAAMKKSGA